MKRAWTDEEADIAAHMLANPDSGLTRREVFLAISKALDRTYWSVRSRHIDYGDAFRGARREPKYLQYQKFNVVIEDRIMIPNRVLEEREHRLSLEPRSITASFFGDPLPGYSALDRARQ